jgi:hypothetical protein
MRRQEWIVNQINISRRAQPAQSPGLIGKEPGRLHLLCLSNITQSNKETVFLYPDTLKKLRNNNCLQKLRLFH